KGEPIAEPKHAVEKPQDLACFPDPKARPRGFLFPPTFAARAGRAAVARAHAVRPKHVEDWESTAVFLRSKLRKDVFGDFPKLPRPSAKLGKPDDADGVRTTPLLFHPEPKMPVPALLRFKPGAKGKSPACVLLHLDGKGKALEHPLARALVDRSWTVL